MESLVNIFFNFLSGPHHGVGVMPRESDDALRSCMAAENVCWLSAFNAKNVEKMQEMYAADAVLIPRRADHHGRWAIGEFWHARMIAGVRDPTFEILNMTLPARTCIRLQIGQ